MRDIKEIEAKLISDIRISLILMNSGADSGDKNGNRVNYGAATASAGTLNYLGQETEIYVYEEDGFLRSDKFRVNNTHVRVGNPI